MICLVETQAQSSGTRQLAANATWLRRKLRELKRMLERRLQLPNTRNGTKGQYLHLTFFKYSNVDDRVGQLMYSSLVIVSISC
jgi:hypothetical protein